MRSARDIALILSGEATGYALAHLGGFYPVILVLLVVGLVLFTVIAVVFRRYSF